MGISIGSDGKVTLKRLSSPALSGKVSADGRKLGTHTIASDAEILDAAGGNAVKIFPSRLAGMELTSGKVSYYSLNGSGEIDRHGAQQRHRRRLPLRRAHPHGIPGRGALCQLLL